MLEDGSKEVFGFPWCSLYLMNCNQQGKEVVTGR